MTSTLAGSVHIMMKCLAFPANSADRVRPDCSPGARRPGEVRRARPGPVPLVPTVYSVYGNKAGLTRALADAADLAADPSRQIAELEAGQADPQGQLAAMAGFDRRLFERAGDVITLLREAGRSEPELAAVYRDGRGRADQTRMAVFSSWPAGTLRVGLDVPTAVDIYAGLCSIDVYATLTAERGWSPDRVELWWSGSLVRELLS
jgi:TetR/AcrR family transcriptional regulator, regulator of cefoperazone and chloramphenicol sensitivity